MDLIVSKNIFAPNGADIVQTVEAKVVVTDTTPYDLELQDKSITKKLCLWFNLAQLLSYLNLLKGVYFMEFDLQNLMASVDFPITLSMYLLVRIEGKLQNLCDSINELSRALLTFNK